MIAAVVLSTSQHVSARRAAVPLLFLWGIMSHCVVIFYSCQLFSEHISRSVLCSPLAVAVILLPNGQVSFGLGPPSHCIVESS